MSQYEYDQAFWNGPPRFIVCEGDEGAGKTTQVQIMKDWIASVCEREVITVREPGTGNLAVSLRTILLDPSSDVSTYEEILLMAAARIDTRLRHVMPALREGKWVISDRGEISSIVYQGFARDEGAMMMAKKIQDDIRAVVCRGDLYVVFGLPPETSKQRLVDKGATLDRFENASERFRRRTNRGFREIEMLVPGEYRISHVDATRPIEEVTQSLITAIETAF